MWCPYIDRDLEESELSEEHILPLSLGGDDGFTTRVSKEINSGVAAKIDAAIANDPVILFARNAFDARGHSNTPVRVIAKNSEYKGRPAQITFRGNEGPPKVWDARTRKVIPEDEVDYKEIKIKWTIPRFSRLRFIAKVALSAGWECMGEYFRENVAHDELRRIMMASSAEELKSASKHIRTRVDGAMLTHEDTSFSAATVINHACKSFPGSVVFITPSDATVCFSIGVLGNFIGALNVPADTRNFPDTEAFDLGHCVSIRGKSTHRCSLRQFVLGMAKSLLMSEAAVEERQDESQSSGG